MADSNNVKRLNASIIKRNIEPIHLQRTETIAAHCPDIYKTVQKFDVPIINGAYAQYSDCPELEEIPDIRFDLMSDKYYYCTQAPGLFKNCSKLKSSSTSKIDFNHIGRLNELFKGCSSLTSLPILKMPYAMRVSNMFEGCTGLIEVSVDITGGATLLNGMLTGNTSIKKVHVYGASAHVKKYMTAERMGNANAEIVFESDDTSDKDYLEFCDGGSPISISKDVYPDDYNQLTQLPDTFQYYSTCGIDFSGCTKLLKTPDLNSLMDKYSYLRFKFNGCSSLQTINTDKLKIALDGSTSLMFSGCTSLESVPNITVSCIKYDGVMSALSMFENCSSLKNIDNIFVNTSSGYTTNFNVDAKWMFNGCSSLIRLPHLELLAYATDMKELCSGCTNLTSAIIPCQRITSPDQLEHIFYGCDRLNHIAFERLNPQIQNEMRNNPSYFGLNPSNPPAMDFV